jgi:hypothetical protein
MEQDSSTEVQYSVGAITVKFPKPSRVTIYQIEISLKVLRIRTYIAERDCTDTAFLNLIE